jgi:hypothetical protein
MVSPPDGTESDANSLFTAVRIMRGDPSTGQSPDSLVKDLISQFAM